MCVVSSIWQRTTGEEDVLHYDIIIFFDYEMTSVNAMRCGVGCCSIFLKRYSCRRDGEWKLKLVVIYCTYSPPGMRWTGNAIPLLLSIKPHCA